MNSPFEPVSIRNIEFNKDFARAYDLLENTDRNIFITGKAGTGKSTLLQYFREHSDKNVAVLAPTGVAAVNIQGQTIHSFFRFKPDITPDRVQTIRLRKTQKALYQKVDTVVIDEISMVRADLLDCVDTFLKLHGRDRQLPFGGVQIVMIGDLYQLPPVVTEHEQDIFGDVYASPYFFDSKVYRELHHPTADHPRKFEVIELTKIYRQKEEKFIKLLGTIRDRTATPTHLKTLNERCDPHFTPPEADFYVHLTTTNAMADKVNLKKLAALPSENYMYEGTLTGQFGTRILPTAQTLELKIGAQVMLLNNDPQGRWINGTIGKIIDILEDCKVVGVELYDGNIVEVAPFKWEMFKFFYNEDTQALESEAAGSFTQYPLRLAWAVTIHKAQGKTFPKVVIDLGRGSFAHGQTYVALSRCTNIEGLVLKRPILMKHILLDDEVVRFMGTHAQAAN